MDQDQPNFLGVDMPDTFEIGGVAVAPGERGFTRLSVTSLLVGSDLGIPLHILHGAKPGPVFGLISTIHGMEHFGVRIVRDIIMDIDPRQLAGTILCIPVANPVAFARGKRNTPEEDISFANLNRVFPGLRGKPGPGGAAQPLPGRSLTEWIAATLVEHFFPRMNFLLDFHCHWDVGGLLMLLQELEDGTETNRRAHDMALYYDVGMINENATMGVNTATGYATSLGVACVPVEVGAGALPEAVQLKSLDICVNGALNVLRRLEMIPGAPSAPRRQVSGHVRPHIRPTKAGYLISNCEPEDLFREGQLGIPVKKGDILAEVFDPYSLETVERIVSPVDGIVYMTRGSGPVEAGAHGFSIVDTAQARWIE